MLYNIPPGCFLTTYYNINIFGAICFIVGWLCRAVFELLYLKLKARKEQEISQESQEVEPCQGCKYQQN